MWFKQRILYTDEITDYTHDLNALQIQRERATRLQKGREQQNYDLIIEIAQEVLLYMLLREKRHKKTKRETDNLWAPLKPVIAKQPKRTSRDMARTSTAELESSAAKQATLEDLRAQTLAKTA